VQFAVQAEAKVTISLNGGSRIARRREMSHQRADSGIAQRIERFGPA
jgi:hypothetical protein